MTILEEIKVGEQKALDIKREAALKVREMLEKCSFDCEAARNAALSKAHAEADSILQSYEQIANEKATEYIAMVAKKDELAVSSAQKLLSKAVDYITNGVESFA